jgi:tetratricopeptide (TPR) repeat protein
MRRLAFSLISLLMLSGLAVEARAQLDGPALMHEGNALFRSGLYRGALLRYQEARARGLDSALLDYNVGITYYKIGEYTSAAESLTAARRDPNLAPLAAYNLGLMERAAGRSAEAQQWFATAAESASNRTLRRLARAATEGPATIVERERPNREQRGTRTEAAAPSFNLTVDAAYGNDDNVHRTPAAPYVDLAQPGQPIVTPVALSAAYVPLKIAVEYLIPNESGDTDFSFRYGLNGKYYMDEFAHDESTQRMEVGASSVFEKTANRKRTLESAFFVTRHYQTDFDPDTGIERDISGVDISHRFNYGSAGIRGDFDHFIGKWRWGLDMRLERREHERTALVGNYDNELYFTGVSVDYALNPATTLSIGMHAYRRLYDARLSRDLAGALLATNPPLEYAYQGAELGITRRILDDFELELSYARLDRTDRYLGYLDFTQDRLSLHGRFRPGSRFSMSFGAVSRVYDYPRAFAFNEPAAGPREIDDLAAEFLAEFRLNGAFTIFAALTSDDVTSTDPRIAYSRAQTVLGMTWRR